MWYYDTWDLLVLNWVRWLKVVIKFVLVCAPQIVEVVTCTFTFSHDLCCNMSKNLEYC